jgi:hypothetical protein
VAAINSSGRTFCAKAGLTQGGSVEWSDRCRADLLASRPLTARHPEAHPLGSCNLQGLLQQRLVYADERLIAIGAVCWVVLERSCRRCGKVCDGQIEMPHELIADLALVALRQIIECPTVRADVAGLATLGDPSSRRGHAPGVHSPAEKDP